MRELKDHRATDCQCEQASCHHGKDEGLGHGPVAAEEVLVLAVFEDDDYDRQGMQLVLRIFRSDRLRHFNMSLARTEFTARKTFEAKVVGSRHAALVGIAKVSAQDLRSLPYIDETAEPPITGRAVCLIDKVEVDDHDGHAAIGWSESQRDLSEKQKQRAGEVAKRNLVKAFGKILSPEHVAWMPDPVQATHTDASVG